MWETKTSTLDGGKLPDTFGKDPRMIAAEKKSGKSSPPHKESHEPDAGPRQEGPAVTKKRSVVERKNTFETMAETQKRETEKRELEKKTREENSVVSRVRSTNTEDEKVAIAAAVHNIESHIRDLSDAVSKLKRELRI
jgi:hypothetical protein